VWILNIEPHLIHQFPLWLQSFFLPFSHVDNAILADLHQYQQVAQVTDFRLAISPLTNSYQEIWEGFVRIAEYVQSGGYQHLGEAKSSVT